MATTIDTTGLQTRRTLRFETIDELLAEVDRIAEAERAGCLECMGNWKCGQIFGHLATWAGFLYVKAPLKTPWHIRLILGLLKNRIINGGMRPGVKIPNVPGGTVGTEPLSLDEGVTRYKAALERLRRDPPTEPSPAFGTLTHEQAIKLNLRHAELHLGFVREKP